MHRAWLCALAAWRLAAAAEAPYTLVQQIHSDNFTQGLAQWRAELEKPGTIAARDGALSIDVPAGCTLWFNPELSGPVLIQYEATAIRAGGPNDRVSDLNAFWMASGSDLHRSGKFADYNNLRTYYAGQGGNTNTTTRFRRYIGDAVERPLLPEHDLRDPAYLLQPNVRQTIQLVAMGHRIQYYAGGKLIFDFEDPDPYTRGRFALRTTQSHLEIRNFQVWRIAPKPVRATEDAASVQLDNGLVSLTFSKQTGTFHAIRAYVAGALRDIAAGPEAYYWDCNTQPDQPPAAGIPDKGYFRPQRPAVRLIANADSAEIIASVHHTAHLLFDVDLHYVLRQGDSGFYSYAVFRHPADLAATTLEQTRFVSKTTNPALSNFVIADERIREIDRSERRQELMNVTYLLADGTIASKYQNSVYWADTLVYGDAGEGLGLWSVTASPEYHNGGPLKQGQTVHDNVLLRVLQSVHFGASPVHIAAREQWTRVYGPVFTYINQTGSVADLWRDAQLRQRIEAGRWPYPWVTDPAYIKQRGTVTGQWTLTGETPHAGAWVVLAQPSAREGDWPLQSKGYQFWARTGADGKFTIRNVIPGTYALYVSGADQPRQFERDGIVVAAGAPTSVHIDWPPERHGRTLWQIGTFDRTAAEFRNGRDARQFEMARRYPKDFPDDVVYTIGQSDPAKDWNYAQWVWYSHRPVWTIRFPVDSALSGSAVLTIGIASAQPLGGGQTRLQVKVNGALVDTLRLPKTGTAGYRGSAQDSAYNLREIRFDAGLLHSGTNEITLGHADAQPFPPEDVTIAGRLGQVMYDALRLEIEPRP